MYFTRERTKKVKVGNIAIGGNNDIVIQSMTKTKTSDIKGTLKQIYLLNKLGCNLVRVAVLDNQDAKTLAKIVKLSHCPIIADIHFNADFALQAIKAKVAKIRINPGNLKNLHEFKQIIIAAKKNNVAIRIGVNTGSLPKNIKTNSQIVNLMKKYVVICEKNKFHNIILSFKSSNINKTLEINKLLAQKFKYPIHIGATEAGDIKTSCVRSTLLISKLLALKIGNTIRVSTTDNPCDEVVIAKTILQENGYKVNLTHLISCPTCGRNQIDLFKLLNEIKPIIDFNPKNITIAIMGCLVNGINESKNADIGIYGLKDKYVIYLRHKKIGTFNYSETIKKFKSIYKKYN